MLLWLHVHIASFIVLFVLVLPFCVFLLLCSRVLISEFLFDKKRFSPGPGYLNLVYGDFLILMIVILLLHEFTI
jgi:hypothetical protein